MEGFRRLAAFMVDLAASCCDGRLVALQEGGYSAEYVPFCTLAAIEGLAGRRSGVTDTHEGASELDRSRREYRRQQSLAIDDVIAVQKAYWNL
jgi:acetoin utilization deacetylase AcuC-like enzyme